MEEGRGPKVQESEGPRSKGPRYLKVTFKYELDSKEGPSCRFCFSFSTMFSLFALFYTGKTRLHTNFGSGLLLAHFWICTKTLCFLHFWKFRVFFIFAPFFLCFLQLLLKFLAFVNLEINCFFAPIFSSKNKCFLEKMVQKRN